MASMDLATALGIAGIIANVLWPLCKQRSHLLTGQVIACGLMAAHFALLSASVSAGDESGSRAQTAVWVMLVAGVQALLAIPLEKHPGFKRVYLVSLLLMPLVCMLSWQGMASVFSSLALAFFCWGNLQSSLMRLRLLLLCCLFSWMVHNAIVASLPALISNGLALITSLIGLYKLHRTRALSSSVTPG